MNSRTSNFHLFKCRNSLWIVLNVVPAFLYSKEAIFQAQLGAGKKKKTEKTSFSFSH